MTLTHSVVCPSVWRVLGQHEERLKKIASKSHKDKVAEFNKYLESLSEHHDIPRVRGGRASAIWLQRTWLTADGAKSCLELLAYPGRPRLTRLPRYPFAASHTGTVLFLRFFM